MYFTIKEEWEITDQLVNFIFFDKERHYPFVKLALNTHIFHVDLEVPTEIPDTTATERLLAADFEQALILSETKDIIDSSISIQTRRAENSDEEYHISTIVEVLTAAEKKDGYKRVRIYRCLDGSTIFDPPFKFQMSDLKDFKQVYLKVTGTSEQT